MGESPTPFGATSVFTRVHSMVTDSTPPDSSAWPVPVAFAFPGPLAATGCPPGAGQSPSLEPSAGPRGTCGPRPRRPTRNPYLVSSILAGERNRRWALIALLSAALRVVALAALAASACGVTPGDYPMQVTIGGFASNQPLVTVSK